MSEKLVVQEPAPVVQVGASDIIQLFANMAKDPAMDADKMERVMAMYERAQAKEAEKAFIAAKSRIMAKLPMIKKTGEIMEKDKKTIRSRFVKYEHLQECLDPLLIEEGFSIDFNSASQTGKLYELFCTLSHREGHSETKTLPLPIDASQFRTDVQNVASTLSFGKRQLTMMHFPIRQEGVDDDGTGGDKEITEDQAITLRALVEEVALNTTLLFKILGVETVEKILARDYDKAVALCEAKRSMKK